MFGYVNCFCLLLLSLYMAYYLTCIHCMCPFTQWGAVERRPRRYDWTGYRQLFDLVASLGLKLQVVIAFHACGGNVGDNAEVPLPGWVLAAGERDPDIFFTDRPRETTPGQRNRECISLFAAEEPGLLKGRSPLQCYIDFMRAFRDEFLGEVGGLIEEVVIGSGPCGELRYPSYPEPNGWRFPGIGEFQCYDRRALASLARAANAVGRPEWGNAGPHDAGTYNCSPEETGFFTGWGGRWDSDYGHFFLSWYAQSLIAHGDRMLAAASAVFNFKNKNRKVPSADGDGEGITTPMSVDVDGDRSPSQMEAAWAPWRQGSGTSLGTNGGGSSGAAPGKDKGGGGGGGGRTSSGGSLGGGDEGGGGSGSGGPLSNPPQPPLPPSTATAAAVNTNTNPITAASPIVASILDNINVQQQNAANTTTIAKKNIKTMGTGSLPDLQQLYNNNNNNNNTTPSSPHPGNGTTINSPVAANAGNATTTGGGGGGGGGGGTVSRPPSFASFRSSSVSECLNALEDWLWPSPRGPAVGITLKIAGVHWWYRTRSHAAELTAGYYNANGGSGYDPLVALCAKYGASLTLTCVEMCDAQHPPEALCGPEGLLRQVREAATAVGVDVGGENALPCFMPNVIDEVALQRVVYNTQPWGTPLEQGAGGSDGGGFGALGPPEALISTAESAVPVFQSSTAFGLGPGPGPGPVNVNVPGGDNANMDLASPTGGGGGGGGTIGTGGGGGLGAARLPPMRNFTFLRLTPEMMSPSYFDKWNRFMGLMEHNGQAFKTSPRWRQDMGFGSQ